MWSFAALGNEHEHLNLEGIAHWNYHPASGLQLVNQRGRNVVSAGGHVDAVKGPLLGPTEVRVAHSYLNILIAEGVQPPACGRAWWLDDFDGIDLRNQRRK